MAVLLCLPLLASPLIQGHKGRNFCWLRPQQYLSFSEQFLTTQLVLSFLSTDCTTTSQQILSTCWMEEHITAQLRKWSLFHWRAQCSLVPPCGRPWWCHSTQPQKFYLQDKTGVREESNAQCWAGKALLLLSSPDDDHATGVTGGQQALVAVEADIKHRCTVALQLIDSSLGRPLHIKEVNAHILTACHCPDERERVSGGYCGTLAGSPWNGVWASM